MKVTSLLVFIALAAYLTVYIVHRASNPVRTALTVTASMSESAPMSGLVIRNELLINSREQYIEVTAEDGSKVAGGQEVAVAYSSEEALERASRLHLLSREIEDVASGESNTVQAAGNREETVFSALTGLSSCLRGGDLSEVDARAGVLSGLIFPSDAGTDTSEEYLAQLQEEYDELKRTSAGDTTPITVSQSGTFSSVVDGYEGVDPAYAQDLTPSALRELIAAERVVDNSSLGKLITSYDWYYVGIIPQEYGRTMLPGQDVELSFGRYYSGTLDAEVDYVGRAEGSEQIVIFRIEKGMADMLAVRAVNAELIYEEYTGLRVPLKGLYRYYAGYLSDADGAALEEGQTVTLDLNGVSREAFVSEIGSASRYGDLPLGVESGSEEDDRPKRRLVVFCWPWTAEDEAPDTSAGGGTVTVGSHGYAAANYYEYDPENPDAQDRLCVFTMTGLQAERKLVSMVYAGEEYCLLSSEGTDALREGNEVILRARDLYNGRVFS